MFIGDDHNSVFYRSSHLSNMAFDNSSEEISVESPSLMLPSTLTHNPTGRRNLSKGSHQLNASPILTTTVSPTVNKDHWQQRRYTFLSKHSMFGGELKDEFIEQHDTGMTVEQKSSMIKSTSMECTGSNKKRESIIGMAVSGVRNFLVEHDNDEAGDISGLRLKKINLTPNKSQLRLSNNETTEFNQNDSETIQMNHQCTQTSIDLNTRKCSRVHNVIEENQSNHFSLCDSLKRITSVKRHSSKKTDTEMHQCYRPYFTYWVTFVQILVCIVSLLVYGHAPLTLISINNASSFDLTTNPWFGPHPADLTRLGAKYTPCMRRHEEVERLYEKQLKLEQISGCCIDRSTGQCMQTLSQQCLARSGLSWYDVPLNGTFFRQEDRIIYPAVCGLTPETCTKRLIGNAPRQDESLWRSTVVDSKIFKWSFRAIQWPICLEQDYSRIANNITLYPHMQCTNIARPCCVGMFGDCLLTSQDDCHRRRGIFHQRAHLCSQVDCIQSVCGMLEFFVAHLPDQVYRFWTVIFIHAGLIHLLITILFQYTIMRPLEKLAGCIRVMIIYVVSGFVGSLASALFLRDSIQVGPGAGQFAVLACYLSELFIGWRSLKRPWIPFFKILICLIILFIVGLFPLIDNYSQCFGFLIGFLLNMIVFPDVNFRKNVRRLVVVTTALTLTIVLFIVLIVLFYTVPFHCSSCQIF